MLAILALATGFYFTNQPPQGDDELAIWQAIQTDERITKPGAQPVAIVRWERGRHFGDLAPTDTIIVSSYRGMLKVSASAYCDEFGWKASIGTVVPVN